MNTPTKVRSEHDYVLNELSLIIPRLDNKKYNMTSHMIRLVYTEDIFTGCIYGSLIIDDSIDYPTLIPLVGQEKIKFSLSLPGNDESLEFEGFIYKISDKEIQGKSQKNQAYTLHFISDVGIISSKTRITKSWRGKLYSDIVKQIYDEHLPKTKNLFVEETIYLQNFLITNEKPLGAIKKISKRAISNNLNQCACYLFYEDRDSYNFVSIDTLLEKDANSTINYSIRNIGNPENFLNTVNSYHTIKLNDFFDEINKGYISSKLFTVDPIRRKFNNKNFNLSEEWDKFSHTDKHKPFIEDDNLQIESNNSTISMIISDENQDAVNHLIEKDTNINPDKLEDVILKHNSQLYQIKKQFITVSLPGDTKYKAGDTIKFNMPEVLGKTSKSSPQEMDKFRSGKYLIASVAHIVQPNAYNVNMELIKDSFVNEIFHRDPIELYKDQY